MVDALIGMWLVMAAEAHPHSLLLFPSTRRLYVPHLVLFEYEWFVENHDAALGVGPSFIPDC